MSTVITLHDWLQQKQENQESEKRLFLTENEVRSFLPYKDATDEEVANIIATIHDLALLTYDAFCREVNNSQILEAA
jgi:hypothetical protein